MVDPEQLMAMREWVAGFGQDDIGFVHAQIRLFASMYLAEGVAIENEMIEGWKILIGEGWFSRDYFRKLSILALGNMVKNDGRLDLVEVVQALIRNELPPPPDGYDQRYLWNSSSPMPIESAVEIEGFVSGGN
jgi:hypothetical protein